MTPNRSNLTCRTSSSYEAEFSWECAVSGIFQPALDRLQSSEIGQWRAVLLPVPV